MVNIILDFGEKKQAFRWTEEIASNPYLRSKFLKSLEKALG